MAGEAAKALTDWLSRAPIGPDGRIPAERTLAAELGLSRAELRKALAELEADGRLLRQVGRGSYLQGDLPEAGADRSDGPLDELVDGLAPRDILRARLAIEPELARLAAQEATPRQIQSLRLAAEAFAEVTTWEAYDEADIGFHRALAGASGNALLDHLHAVIWEARSSMAWGRLVDRSADPPADAPWLTDLSAIVAGIADRDRHAAETAMRHHLLVEAATILGGLP